MAGENVLLQFEGSFNDSSSYGHTVTASGGVSLDTSVFKVGASSAYFPSTGGPNLAVSGFDFGASDFTIQGWVRPLADASVRSLFGKAVGTGFYPINLRRAGDGTVVVYATDGANVYTISGTATLPDSTWRHVAVVRSGTVLSLWIDGVFAGSTTLPSGLALFANAAPFCVGNYSADYAASGGTSAGWYGNVDSFSVSPSALYTAAFSPPDANPLGAAALSAVSTLGGVLTAPATLTSSLAATATLSGQLAGTAAQLVASMSSAAALAAALSAGIRLTSAPAAQAALSGALTSGIKLSSSLAATAALTGQLQVTAGMSAALLGSTTIGAQLSTAIALSSALQARSSVVASLLTATQLRAVLAANVELGGALASAPASLVASLVAHAALQGELLVVHPFAGPAGVIRVLPDGVAMAVPAEAVAMRVPADGLRIGRRR